MRNLQTIRTIRIVPCLNDFRIEGPEERKKWKVPKRQQGCETARIWSLRILLSFLRGFDWEMIQMKTMFRGVFGDWFGAAFVDFLDAQQNAKNWNKDATVIAVRLPTWEKEN